MQKRPAAWLLLLVAAFQVAAGASIAKRSLSALARTSQLPNSSTAPADQAGHDQDHPGAHSGQAQNDKRSMLQEEAIREELLRQHAVPATEALLSAIMAAERYGSEPNGVEEKRSVSSLARYGNLPASPAEKRSLEALARGGLLNKNSRVESSKRSVSTLARAGELPGKRWMPPHQREYPHDLIDVLQRELEEEKRSLSSLAKSGGITRPAESLSFPMSAAEQQMKRSLESLARNWNLPEKRSLESLARNWNLPEKRSLESLARNWNLPEKRSLESLARNWNLPEKRSLESLARTWNKPAKRSPPYGAFDEDDFYAIKRNAAALLRQSKLSTGSDGPDDSQRHEETERHDQGRRKRSLWDEEVGEVVAPYAQSAEQDWDAAPAWSPAAAWAAYLASYGDEATEAAPMQKRFLGRIPNMGRHRQKTNEDSSPRRRRPH
ncbi:uncharacterized protein LOC117647279 isoform X1 [Thrips palmi]|uniref:Uncharacterized protein LOC117647279 isoform X1 n=1 Tax=Thrips palmi TaxID=161013 RepID=A0A6P8Z4Z8_THRPL|nr:uncharacterized protein LOC117647279 isoform X1 [Thrips palmi]